MAWTQTHTHTHTHLVAGGLLFPTSSSLCGPAYLHNYTMSLHCEVTHYNGFIRLIIAGHEIMLEKHSDDDATRNPSDGWIPPRSTVVDGEESDQSSGKYESSHVISRGEILCHASVTPETEIMLVFQHAHSWIHTYYFTWQHMFLALLYNAIGFGRLCCFCAWANKLLLAIPQVAVTFISSRHWEINAAPATYTYVCELKWAPQWPPNGSLNPPSDTLIPYWCPRTGHREHDKSVERS